MVHKLSNIILKTTPGSLFQNDLRGALAVHSEVAIRQFDNGAHGLADRVESVDFVKLLLWDLVSYWLVIPLQVQDQSQQAAFCLVSHLFRQTAFLIWRLGGKQRKCLFQGQNLMQQHSLPGRVFFFVIPYRVLVSKNIFFSCFILCKLLLCTTQMLTALCNSDVASSFRAR